MGEGDSDVLRLLSEYEATLRAMSAHRVEGGGDPARWNRMVDHLQELQLELRSSRPGRAGITKLLTDDDETVRSWSATFALSWDEEEARRTLEALATSEGLVGFEAGIALRQFDAGRLNTTWRPKG